MALTKDQWVDEIKGMTVLDLAELVKALEEEFGVSAAAMAAPAAAPAGGGGGGDAAGEEEAKAVVDEAPGPVKEGITREEADKIKGELEEAGATVEVK